jgi:hypothetical protein
MRFVYLPVASSQKLICGDTNFRAIKLHGRPWTRERVSGISDLLADYLSDAQLGELNRAYNDEGVNEIQTVRKVTYHDAVSYEVIGQAEDQSNRYDILGTSNSVKVKVQVGDIIEVRASFEVDGRGFVEVVAVMRHCNTVFLVGSWVVRMADNHHLLGLPQYRRTPLFGEYRSSFFSLCLVDHPTFVTGTHFVDIGQSILVRNDWVFNVV